MSDDTDFENDDLTDVTDDEFEDFPDDLRMEPPAFSREDNVNRRAGHVAVGYQGSVIVWGGYMENQELDGGDYWPTNEVWIYSSLTGSWRPQKTSGEAPSKCSGAAACVLDDSMYILAGFHKIVVNRRSSRGRHLLKDIGYALSDSDTEDDEDDVLMQMVQISDCIWRLDLQTMVWEKLNPKGNGPLRCDKTSCWSYEGKIYLFGGFGPPPDFTKNTSYHFSFVVDPSTEGEFPRGWSNQLVCYNSRTNKWEWPNANGRPPLPRAAHGVAVIEDAAFIFGGRHQDERLNDLHRLDLTTLTWSNLLPATDYPPIGRSWQVLVPVQTGNSSGGLLIYGGFANQEVTLSDCWKLDLDSNPLSWTRCKHWEDGPRLWHAAACADPGQILIIGGLTNNILAPSHVLKHHAEKVIHINTAPSSLLKICLDYVTKNKKILFNQFEDLPVKLQKIIEVRCSSGA